MGAMDPDTLARTLERVSSLVLITEETREGSSLPAFSLPELQELPELQAGALPPSLRAVLPTAIFCRSCHLKRSHCEQLLCFGVRFVFRFRFVF